MTAAARTPTRPAPGSEGRRRSRLTPRALVVGLVLAVLLVSYASSMRAYLQQRSHLADLRSQIATSQSQVDELARANARWKDDGYVRSQARARLGWVLPGDTAYQVIDGRGHLLDSSDRLADPDEVTRPAQAPWWAKQYSSLQRADHPPAKQSPVGKITKRTPGE